MSPAPASAPRAPAPPQGDAPAAGGGGAGGGLFYWDRAEGRLVAERVYAGSFLEWSYNTAAGRLSTDLLFSRPWASRLYGWLNKTRWSRRRIRPFAEAMGVRLGELKRPLESFESFNDFFTREIDLAQRPLAADPAACLCPADGKVLAVPVVPAEAPFRIKRHSFSLGSFLGDEGLARRFAGGSLAVVRLALADYHHFHFPADGVPGEARLIEGRCYAGGPYARGWLPPVTSVNRRMLTLLKTELFGTLAMVEVGAFTVGSIRQRYAPGERAARGGPKGFFELGGSTVALLFEPGALAFDADLLDNSSRDIETYVRMGDSIGRAARQSPAGPRG